MPHQHGIFHALGIQQLLYHPALFVQLTQITCIARRIPTAGAVDRNDVVVIRHHIDHCIGEMLQLPGQAVDHHDGLFRWVAYLTGSKNAVKGMGIFMGALLLAGIGFDASLWAMAIALCVVFGAVLLFIPRGLPQGRKDARFREVFSKNPNINWLSLARTFLFGARDVWFVVGVPIYFYSTLSQSGVLAGRDAFLAVGAFMACWIILYGGIQALAPRILQATSKSNDAMVAAAVPWAFTLSVIPILLMFFVFLFPIQSALLTLLLMLGLYAFGFFFAVNSSLHSYLILHFTSSGRVTLDVGFYYMANAAGRLLGTILSGLSYHYGGLTLCLGTAALMLVISGIAARKLSPVTAPQRAS